jgi:hypothetical protein
MPEDLWPENIADSNLVSPVTILKEQAVLLGEKTKQLVQGEVETQALGNIITHRFNIVAPTLNYRYELFKMSHQVAFYPLTLQFLSPTMIPSEADLKENLKRIFSSQHTLNVIHSILAQVRS